MENVDRRTVLMGAGAALSVSLAGCSGDEGSVEGSDGSNGVEPPKVNTLNGTWKKQDEGTIERKIKKTVTLGTVHGKTQTFTHSPAANQVKKKTEGEFGQAVGIGFATRFELEGALLSSIPVDWMMGNIGSSFKDQLKQKGITQVRQSEFSGNEPNPKGAKEVQTQGFSGRFSTGPFSIEVEVKKGTERTFEFDDVRLQINSVLSVWKTGEALFAAGGAWPAVSYNQQTDWVSVTGGGTGDGADVKLRIILPFMRSRIRSDVLKLVESTR
ncbi:hypothetical protein ACFO0N_14925 [Halobium salinum]|uniref:Uncharacterized protein n=1 Tax=Halobium salinum TaxID=1364940 RepID=A0ABD5PEA3_9EURY|nr:hypothetical protein [Halobium salinum]